MNQRSRIAENGIRLVSLLVGLFLVLGLRPANAQEDFVGYDPNYQEPAYECWSGTTFMGCVCKDSTGNAQAPCDALCGASGVCSVKSGGSTSKCAFQPCELKSYSPFTETSESKAGTYKQYTLQNPLAARNIPELMGGAVRIFTGVAGSFALLMFVYGSVLWLTSRGNPEQVQKGKKVFTWAVIGLAVIFSAYMILNQVFKTIGAY